MPFYLHTYNCWSSINNYQLPSATTFSEWYRINQLNVKESIIKPSPLLLLLFRSIIFIVFIIIIILIIRIPLRLLEPPLDQALVIQHLPGADPHRLGRAALFQLAERSEEERHGDVAFQSRFQR